MRGMEAHGMRRKALYVNVEDDRITPLTLRDMDTFLRAFRHEDPEGLATGCHLFLDEVQLVKGWERFVRRVIDTEDILVHLTGSSSRLLHTEVAHSMRGRSLTYVLLPFSFGETLRFRGIAYEPHLSTRRRAGLLRVLEEYLRLGGFPEVVLEQDAARASRMLTDLLDVMLVRDVIERHRVRNTLALRALVAHLLGAVASPFSVSKFTDDLRSRGVTVAKPTIYTYLRYLEDAFVILPVKRLGYKPRELMWSLPKIYPIDPGLAAQAAGRSTQDLGRLMECTIAIELLRRRNQGPLLEFYYWKDAHGKEVDFVVREGASVVELIQSCYDVEGYGTKDRELGPLLKASRETGCKRLRVLTWDHEGEEMVKGRKVVYEPLWRWLMGGHNAGPSHP
jgi:predicted AAA+ superfamily ATPase